MKCWSMHAQLGLLKGQDKERHNPEELTCHAFRLDNVTDGLENEASDCRVVRP